MAFTWLTGFTVDGNVGIGTDTADAKLDVEAGDVGGTSGNSTTAAIFRAGRQNFYLQTQRTTAGTDWNNTTFKLLAKIDSTSHQSINFVNDASYNEHIDIYTGNQVFNTRFNANGNVGIGVTDPEKKLEVKSDTTYDGIMLDVLSNPEITFRDRGNSDTLVGTGRHALDGFHIDTYSGNAFFIKGSNRYVGIGTITPQTKLQVVYTDTHTSGDLTLSNSAFDIYNDSTTDVAGKGSTLTFSDNYSGTNKTTRAAIKGGTEDAGNTANGFLAFYTDSGGANSMQERIYINEVGAIKFNNYDSTNRTGTPTYLLGTDASGNVVKTNTVPGSGAGPYLPLAGGTMTGTITMNNNRITSIEELRFNNGGNIGNQINTDVDTGTETVANVSITDYTAAFFDFVVKKTTNVRSGTVYACHDGTSVVYTETSTNDLGDTSDVTLSVDISGTNMRLLATVTSDDWSVKSLIRAI